MTNFQKKLNFLITVIFVISGFFFFTSNVNAATSTIRGKAYWGDYGYIYFNCEDDVIGNLFNETQNLIGKSRYKAPPADPGFHFYSPPCTLSNHGVYIDDNNNFFGKAWNPSLGFISFEHDGTHNPPNYSFNSSHCSQCTSANDCIACYDTVDQTIHGWARVEATDEWLKLDSAAPLPVKLRSGDFIPAGYNVELGDFIGTAMPNSATTFGNVSFNCEGETYPSSTCATRPYRVYIKNLRLGKLSAPNWSYTNACNSTALNAVLRWEKLSGTQTAYEVLVREDNVISTSTGTVCWSGKVGNAEATQYIISNSNPDCGGRLKYNTNYYWWVRAYDVDNKATDWYQYNTNSALSNGGDPDGNPNTFTTYKHEFPNPFFTWDPLIINIGASSTEFTSAGSEAYIIGQPLPQSCEPGLCTYQWSAVGNGIVISASTSSTTLINFWEKDNTTSVSLTVIDSDNYQCSISNSLEINYELPLWREVKAE
jgi:hypothetical protein